MAMVIVMMIWCLGDVMVTVSRVPDQNGISRLYNVLEIHHSGREPSIWYLAAYRNVHTDTGIKGCMASGWCVLACTVTLITVAGWCVLACTVTLVTVAGWCVLACTVTLVAVARCFVFTCIVTLVIVAGCFVLTCTVTQVTGWVVCIGVYSNTSSSGWVVCTVTLVTVAEWCVQ